MYSYGLDCSARLKAGCMGLTLRPQHIRGPHLITSYGFCLALLQDIGYLLLNFR